MLCIGVADVALGAVTGDQGLALTVQLNLLFSSDLSPISVPYSFKGKDSTCAAKLNESAAEFDEEGVARMR